MPNYEIFDSSHIRDPINNTGDSDKITIYYVYSSSDEEQQSLSEKEKSNKSDFSYIN